MKEILKRLKDQVEDAKNDCEHTRLDKAADFYRGFYKGIRFAYDIVKEMSKK